MKNKYLRIGTAYYKKSLYPNLQGGSTEVLISWSAETIRQDHGKNFIATIEKYDGFICLPENRPEFYKQRISDYYNTYHAVSHKPKEGQCPITLSFIAHIFGEQIELGLDYLHLLYLKPTQSMPILCLVSKERSTGKSTFLKWLHAIFEHNLTFLTNADFASNFNSDWTSKLIIAVDEVLFKTDELTERIKYLSTTNYHKTEAKNKDKKEAPFFGKFILCSNNETSFIKIDANEIRFWVRKINPYTTEDVQLMSKLINEIPAFLYFISNRKISRQHCTRHWFSPAELHTQALQKLMLYSSSKIELEVAQVLGNLMDTLGNEYLEFTYSDLLNYLNKFKLKYDASEVKTIIRKKWNLEQQSNSNNYQKIHINADLDITYSTCKGRFYTISKEFLVTNFDDLMNDTL